MRSQRPRWFASFGYGAAARTFHGTVGHGKRHSEEYATRHSWPAARSLAADRGPGRGSRVTRAQLTGASAYSSSSRAASPDLQAELLLGSGVLRLAAVWVAPPLRVHRGRRKAVPPRCSSARVLVRHCPCPPLNTRHLSRRHRRHLSREAFRCPVWTFRNRESLRTPAQSKVLFLQGAVSHRQTSGARIGPALQAPLAGCGSGSGCMVCVCRRV